MKVCPSCHRNTECLHQNPVSVKEVYFVYFLVLIFSQIGYASFFTSVRFSSFIEIGEIAAYELSFLLLLLHLIYEFTGKQYLALFFGCHQKVERSLIVRKRPYIICARCSGIMLGVFLSIMYYSSTVPWWISLILIIPLLVDGLIQKFTEYESNNRLRFITGILFAPGFVLLFGYASYTVHYAFNYLANLILRMFI